jgi:hypothetical protein
LQHLSIWDGTVWIRIGRRVIRSVRYGNYANTWNAGGNRNQANAAGNILYVAGIRGIDPLTQQQLPGPGVGNAPGSTPPNTAQNGNARIDQIYANMKVIVEAEGITLFDCFGIVTGLTSAAYIGPTAAEQALPQFWGAGPYPPRTHEGWPFMSGSDQEIEMIGSQVHRGDIVETTSMFWLGGPQRGRTQITNEMLEAAAAVKEIPGVSVTHGMPAPFGATPQPPKPTRPPEVHTKRKHKK